MKMAGRFYAPRFSPDSSWGDFHVTVKPMDLHEAAIGMLVNNFCGIFSPFVKKNNPQLDFYESSSKSTYSIF